MKRFFGISLVFFLCGMLGACVNEPDCLDLRITNVQFAFRKMFDGRADTVFIAGVEIIGKDTILFQNRITTGLILPLDPFTDGTAYRLFQPAGINEISLSHNRRLQLITEDCGERILIEGVDLSATTLDSVRVLKLEESNPVARVEIYRCPQPSAVRFIFRTLSNGNLISEQVRVVALSTDFFQGNIYSNAMIRAANLPINLASNQATYFFQFEDDRRDTLSITYQSLQRKIFEVCGETTLYNQLKKSYHTFQSVEIVRDSIREPAIINIEIIR
jgi:hypothetical protein